MLLIKGAIWVDSCDVCPEQQPWLQQRYQQHCAEVDGQLLPPKRAQYSQGKDIDGEDQCLGPINIPGQVGPVGNRPPQHQGCL